MGKTSNAAKQRWNAKNYVQFKAYVKPDIANAFKAACAMSGSSIASELSAFMEEFVRTPQTAQPYTRVKTLGDRRKTLGTVLKLLGDMRDAEEAYLGSTPDNLRGSDRYENAEDRLGRLEDAMADIEDIYDQ
jgi:hypothetical protein